MMEVEDPWVVKSGMANLTAIDATTGTSQIW
jgi:hypothetical protein